MHPTHTHNKQMQKEIKEMRQGLVIAAVKIDYIFAPVVKACHQLKFETSHICYFSLPRRTSWSEADPLSITPIMKHDANL